MKLGLVVQRYGAKINGGAELHARYIAELLARHHKVEVLTTCASDYISWRNELPAGTETLRGVTIRRFPVSRERDPRQFGHHSQHVFERKHSLADELAWLDSEGPTSPALIDHLRAHGDDYDYVIFFSYRYYQAYHGARAVPGKAILVPTAERDAAIGLGIFAPLFRGVRAIMYNSQEERAMIRSVARNDHVPGVIVGVGSDVPRSTSPDRFRKKFDVTGPFVIYVGRIDENKGCKELFSFFTGYRPRLGQRLQLLLIGNSILPIPNHPNIRHLGYVSDQDKFDAIAASEALMMPSYYESLSMVALEAWALGRPVLANGKCDVLRGQCVRSRAGLYYENFHEFCEALFTLTTNRPLNEALGDNGRRFYEQNYAWPVIERKYLDVLKRLQQEDAGGRRGASAGNAASAGAAMEPLPGWLARKRRTQPPAMEVVNALPHGPALSDAAGIESPAASSPSDARTDTDTAGTTSGARASSYASSAHHTTAGRPSHSGRSHGPRTEGTSRGAAGREGRERDRHSHRDRDRERRSARGDRGDANSGSDAKPESASAERDKDRDGARDTRAAGRDGRERDRRSHRDRDRRGAQGARGDQGRAASGSEARPEAGASERERPQGAREEEGQAGAGSDAKPESDSASGSRESAQSSRHQGGDSGDNAGRRTSGGRGGRGRGSRGRGGRSGGGGARGGRS